MEPSSGEDLKALARAFFEEIWNQGDESAIDRFLADDAAGNDPIFGTGKEEFTRNWRQWQAGLKDLDFELTDIIAEGDKVLTRWVLTGVHTGEFFGAAPTGRLIRVEGMSFDRIEGGKVVEGCDGWDKYGLFQQIGLIPTPE